MLPEGHGWPHLWTLDILVFTTKMACHTLKLTVVPHTGNRVACNKALTEILGGDEIF